MAVVWIPSLLRPLTGGQRQVTVPGATLGEVLTALDAAYPGTRERLVKGERLQPSIAIAIDGVTANEGLLSAVGPNSELHVIPAIGGG